MEFITANPDIIQQVQALAQAYPAAAYVIAVSVLAALCTRGLG
jgi:hypothetical protein